MLRPILWEPTKGNIFWVIYRKGELANKRREGLNKRVLKKRTVWKKDRAQRKRVLLSLWQRGL